MSRGRIRLVWPDPDDSSATSDTNDYSNADASDEELTRFLDSIRTKYTRHSYTKREEVRAYPFIERKEERMSKSANEQPSGGQGPSHSDFVAFIQATRDQTERVEQRLREERREERREDRQELLNAIAAVGAEIRGVKDDLHKDIARVETSVSALTVKTDNNDRQILEAQTTVKVLLVVITVIGAVVSIVAGIAQFT